MATCQHAATLKGAPQTRYKKIARWRPSQLDKKSCFRNQKLRKSAFKKVMKCAFLLSRFVATTNAHGPNVHSCEQNLF